MEKYNSSTKFEKCPSQSKTFDLIFVGHYSDAYNYLLWNAVRYDTMHIVICKQLKCDQK